MLTFMNRLVVAIVSVAFAGILMAAAQEAHSPSGAQTDCLHILHRTTSVN